MAERIFSMGGGPAHFTIMIAPPLKSIPYFTPPCSAILNNPATESTREAPMKGHFHFRKSKFVFLNISMEPCRAGCLFELDTGLSKIVPQIARRVKTRPQGYQILSSVNCLRPESS